MSALPCPVEIYAIGDIEHSGGNPAQIEWTSRMGIDARESGCPGTLRLKSGAIILLHFHIMAGI